MKGQSQTYLAVVNKNYKTIHEMYLQWDFSIFHKEHLELTDTDTQISIGELVRNVEPKSSELTTLNDHGVEQAQGQKQMLELHNL